MSHHSNNDRELEIETLIEDERAIRTLSTSLISFKSDSLKLNPYFTWFGILQPNQVIFEYPSENQSLIQSEISKFLRADGIGFCFPDPSLKIKRPFIFKITLDLCHYYGICLQKKKSQTCVFITPHPWFSKYILALETIVKLTSSNNFDKLDGWLKNFYQTRIPTTFTYDQHRDAILEWGLSDVLIKLPVTGELLKLILSAIILERQIILISTDLYLLSATILCLPLLIHPFTYQCHDIPIVPSSLLDLLASPTPFVAGVPRYPDNYLEISSSTIIINLDRSVVLSKEIKFPPIEIPNFDQLVANVSPYLQFKSERQHLYSAVVASLFEDFFSDLFNIEIAQKYRICKRNGDERISIFLSECFLGSLDVNHKSFYLEFMQTQIFTQAINFILREIDS